MTPRGLEARLRRLEQGQGITVPGRIYCDAELQKMSDAQLASLIRAGYRQMVAEHGSLSAAAADCRDKGQIELAAFIEDEVRRERRNEPLA